MSNSEALHFPERDPAYLALIDQYEATARETMNRYAEYADTYPHCSSLRLIPRDNQWSPFGEEELSIERRTSINISKATEIYPSLIVHDVVWDDYEHSAGTSTTYTVFDGYLLRTIEEFDKAYSSEFDEPYDTPHTEVLEADEVKKLMRRLEQARPRFMEAPSLSDRLGQLVSRLLGSN
ncbi:MAG TPA: hypothetical protein VFH39_02740 [Candidatus Saccharimonadales bacterium]|nr:hypothetical protein [Candidatus Saccharimonadales bacterium]